MKKSFSPWTITAVIITSLSVGCHRSHQSDKEEISTSELVIQNKNSPSQHPRMTGDQINFEDRTNESGISFIYHNSEESGHFSILESLGGGLAVIDFDLDGREDLCFAGGGEFSKDNQINGLPSGLFRNMADWSFEDVTNVTGINHKMVYSHGIFRADYDSDGFPDFLVTGYGDLLLFQNQGDGTFQEVSLLANLSETTWSVGAAWGDYDGDGHLDLFVTQYVDWSFKNDPYCPGPTPNQREVCPPRVFQGLPDLLLMSNGDGTFRNTSSEAGLLPQGKGLGVVSADLDLDGDLDIYVTNDTVRNHLYENQGDGTFVDSSLMSGTGVSDQGSPDGSMGVELIDYNLDGLLDLWVVNFEKESAALYRNEGKLFFRHVSQSTGITAAGGLYVGWGTCCFDADNDGDEDIFVSNGHVVQFPTQGSRNQLPVFYENLGAGNFRDIAKLKSGFLSQPHMGRGAATADLDQDGDLDLVVSHLNETASVLVNTSKQSNAWIEVDLIGTISPRDAIGAVVKVKTKSGSQTQHWGGGGSYASTSSRKLFFGLGNADKIEEIEITWPSGISQEIQEQPMNCLAQFVEKK